jgi:UDP-glucuronate decarboxylase
MYDNIHSFEKILADDLLFITSRYDIEWDLLKNKTVLITGASGFLARYLLETLIFLNQTQRMNVKIIALGRSQKEFERKLGNPTKLNEIVFIEGDVCETINLDCKIDFIIHAASQASPKFYFTDPVGTLSANIIGTKMLLDLAREHNVDAFLYFSSAEVYGQVNKTPTAETELGSVDQLNVRSCYAESKRMGENMCIAWHHQYNVPTKIVRPFHTYGPGMKLDDGRVYADFVASALAGESIEIKSDGLAKRAFCYIADATAGFWMVLLKGNNAEAYNIGNPNGEISIHHLAKLIAELDPTKQMMVTFKHHEDRGSYMPSKISAICPDVSKAINLGWNPLTSLQEGFTKTIESYK